MDFLFSNFATLHPTALLKITPLGTRLGIEMQPRYEALDDFGSKIEEIDGDLHRIKVASPSTVTLNCLWRIQVELEKKSFPKTFEKYLEAVVPRCSIKHFFYREPPDNYF